MLSCRITILSEYINKNNYELNKINSIVKLIFCVSLREKLLCIRNCVTWFSAKDFFLWSAPLSKLVHSEWWQGPRTLMWGWIGCTTHYSCRRKRCCFRINQKLGLYMYFGWVKCIQSQGRSSICHQSSILWDWHYSFRLSTSSMSDLLQVVEPDSERKQWRCIRSTNMKRKSDWLHFAKIKI